MPKAPTKTATSKKSSQSLSNTIEQSNQNGEENDDKDEENYVVDENEIIGNSFHSIYFTFILFSFNLIW